MDAVYIINGFLESGKTEFILFTLDQPYFRINGTTLLLLCEEGEAVYTEQLLWESDTALEIIDSPEDFNVSNLKALEKKHKPERVIIEWNGMWDFRQMILPDDWSVEQQITLIDASTFKSYFGNMKSLFAEMIRGSEMILMNRCDGLNNQLDSFKRNIKAINQTAEIIFEDQNGEINEILEEELPFDINAEIIDLDDTGYAIWYIDSFDHPDRYNGKKVRFKAIVMKPEGMGGEYFAPGRQAMTCCADDIAFLAFPCHKGQVGELSEKEWYEITASVSIEEFAGYNGKGPVLEALAADRTDKPEEEVIDFSKI